MTKTIFFTFLGVIILYSCNRTKDMSDKAVYSGENISKNAFVIKDISSETTILHIDIAGDWYLYGGNSIEEIDFSKPVKEGNTTGDFIIDVPFNVRNYFQLVTEKGKSILAETKLPMEGGYNFRDMGGIQNSEGKYVKWGKLFRADELGKLSDSDLKYLAGIPLISIVDFRSKEEIDALPDKNPESVKMNYPFSINPGNLNVSNEFDISNITPEQVDSIMISLNKELVTNPEIIEIYREFFRLIQNEDNVPLLFHCTAGKDRTGMGAALILFSLGVDENTILDNYLLSNKFLEEKYASYKSEFPVLKSLFEVKPEFLYAGINLIKENHGSVENYLTNILNVDLEKMKEMYLY
ncbi:MAG: tyrosine-protein phosphatase [Bacteroidales bacterium]|jgi:protein-tyrosine phosphatase|nr:tyrosine-protein phosphatase [Bacteroidales bacterium]